MRFRRVFQAAGLLAAIAFLAVMQSRYWFTTPLMSTRGPGFRGVGLLPEPVTKHALEEIAAGLGGDGTGLRRLLGESVARTLTPGDAELHVALTTPDAATSEFIHWGWPVSAVMVVRDAVYTDVYARDGMQTAAPRGVSGWRRFQWRAESIHPRLGRQWFFVMPLRPASSLLVILLTAWIVGWIAAIALGRLAPTTRLARRRHAIPVAAAIGALFVVVGVSLIPWRDPRSSFMPANGAALEPTGLTVEQLRTLPASDLARAILDAAETSANGEYLALGWHWPHAQTSGQIDGLWPDGMFFAHVGERNHDVRGSGPSAEAWGATDWDVVSDRVRLSVLRREVGGSQRYGQYTVEIDRACWVLLALMAAWFGPALPVRVAGWRRQRRTRRRLTRGQCVRCGYDGVRSVAT